jgi:predicted lipoprotein with Yx(FWY)xxD motif
MRRWLLLLAVGALGAALAACGGGTPAQSGISRATTPSSHATVLYVNPTNVGRVVTLPYGDPVYVNVDEHEGSRASCTGSCANSWVPVMTGQAPKGASGIESSDLGTANYDGKKQVTYFGHRLYYYASDHHPLTASGQGQSKTWFVILPTGQPLLAP